MKSIHILGPLLTSILITVPSGSSMDLGVNFWNLGWHKPNDCFQDFKNVTGDNPWNPQFLKEGGQHVTKNAKAINTSGLMFDLTREYLREMGQYFEHFCYYAHVGRAGDRGAWGAIEFTGQPPTEAHKYRALVEHPQPGATQKP